MKVALTLCAVLCLAGVTARVDCAASSVEQVIETWEGRPIGATAGSIICRDGATAGEMVVTRTAPYRGARTAGFDFEMLSKESGRVFQAEDATTVGCTKFTDTGASGAKFIGEFGEKPGDSVLFEKVPDGEELTVWFTNGTGAPKQCSLYIDGNDVATLNFPTTPTWWSPFHTLTYKGKVTGSVKLQVDQDDLDANKVFVCNVDKILVGPPEPRPLVEARLELSEFELERGMRYLGFAIRSPLLTTHTLVIEDSSGVAHVGRTLSAEKDNQWEYAVVDLDETQPRLDTSSAPVSIRAVTLQCSSDSTQLRGTVCIDELKLSKGWPSNPPPGCPLEPSKDILGVRFTGRYKEYTQADTWYPSWASDGNMYSCFTDGFVEGVFSNSSLADATTGMAKIEGDDPVNLKVSSLGLYTSRPWPYATRYPCGTLVYDGVWYYGTYIINGDARPGGLATYEGPFVGFRYSTDYGKTWTETPCTPLHNLFGETVDAVPGGYSKVKMGSPHIVDFGKNMEHSPDGKAYLVAHGCVKPDALHTWLNADRIYLARVKPSIRNMNDVSKYEFFAGNDKNGRPIWSRKFSDIQPLYEWNGRAGCVTMTYNAPLKRYLMCVSTCENIAAVFDTYILESKEITGPWKLVTYMEQFGTQAYFVSIPSKFISADGRKMWLSYSANWTGHKPNPLGSSYAMCLHEMELLTP